MRASPGVALQADSPVHAPPPDELAQAQSSSPARAQACSPVHAQHESLANVRPDAAAQGRSDADVPAPSSVKEQPRAGSTGAVAGPSDRGARATAPVGAKTGMTTAALVPEVQPVAATGPLGGHPGAEARGLVAQAAKGAEAEQGAAGDQGAEAGMPMDRPEANAAMLASRPAEPVEGSQTLPGESAAAVASCMPFADGVTQAGGSNKAVDGLVVAAHFDEPVRPNDAASRVLATPESAETAVAMVATDATVADTPATVAATDATVAATPAAAPKTATSPVAAAPEGAAFLVAAVPETAADSSPEETASAGQPAAVSGGAQESLGTAIALRTSVVEQAGAPEATAVAAGVTNPRSIGPAECELPATVANGAVHAGAEATTASAVGTEVQGCEQG